MNLIEVEGRLVLPSDKQALGILLALSSETAQPSDYLAVVCSFEVFPEQAGSLVKLVGVLAHDVFEAREMTVIEAATHINITTSSSSSSKRKNLTGRVHLVSPSFSFRDGPLVFVELECDAATAAEVAQQALVRIVLAEELHGLRAYLRPGRTYTFYGFEQTKWSKHDEEVWYVGKKLRSSCVMTHNKETPLERNNMQLSLNAPLPEAWLRMANMNAFQRAMHVATEIDVQGTVKRLHTSGWIELVSFTTAFDVDEYSSSSSCTSSSSGVTTDECIGAIGAGCGDDEDDVHANGLSSSSSASRYPGLCIYLTCRRSADLDTCLRSGCVFEATSVLPVYVWGVLRGFAATARSHISIKAFTAPPSPPTSSSSSSSSSSLLLDVPKEFKGTCHLFTAWRAITKRTLLAALLGRINSDSDYFIALQKQVVCCYKAGESMDTIIISSGSRSSRKSLPLLELFLLDKQRTVQMEFSDCLYAELFMVRAGKDSDYLNSQLPKIWSCSKMRDHASRFLRELYTCRPAIIDEYATHLYEQIGKAVDDSSDANLAASSFSFENHFVASVNEILVTKVPTIAQLPSCHASSLSGLDDDDEDEDDGVFLVLLKVTDSKAEDLTLLVTGASSRDTLMSQFALLAQGNKIGQAGGRSSRGGGEDEEKLKFKSIYSNFGLERVLSFASAKEKPAVVVRNPLLLITENPFYNEDSAHVLVITDVRSMSLVVSAQHQRQAQDAMTPVSTMSSYLCTPAAMALAIGLKGCVLEEALCSTAFNSSSSFSAASSSSSSSSCSSLSLPPSSVAHLPYTFLTVRQALMTSTSSAILPILVGVIVMKELVADQNDENAWVAKDAKRQKCKSKQCSLLLRDVAAADTIKVYVPLAKCESMLVGFVVVIYNSIIKISSANRANVMFNDESRFGVLGLAPVVQVRHFCKEAFRTSSSSSSSSFGIGGMIGGGGGGGGGVGGGGFKSQKQIERGRAVAVPLDIEALRCPRTCVSKLWNTRKYNRCSWTLFGRIVYVNSIYVKMQCSNTSCPAPVHLNGSNRCPTCRHFLQKVWAAQVVLDDGTGECVLFVEGDAVLQLIKPVYGDDELSPRDIRQIVEEAVEKHGRVNYNDSIARKAHAVEAAAAAAASTTYASSSSSSSSSHMYTEDENAAYCSQYLKPEDVQAAASSVVQSIRAEEILVQYVANVDKTAYHEVTCRLIFLREQMGNEFALSSRTIKLQNENSQKKYTNYTSTAQTTTLQNHLSLQVVSLKTLSRDQTKIEVWNRLHSL